MSSLPNSRRPAAKQPISNPLSVIQPGEEIICEIKRHPIGIVGMYVAIGLLLIAVAVMIFVIMPHAVTGFSHSQAVLLSFIMLVIIATLSAGFLFIISKIYWGNSWVVTTDSITQIRQTGLFDKQVSQLSLGNLEDITAEQDGMLEQMLHYGTISAETAGAADKFTFPFCPNPNYYAKKILAAREDFEQHRRHDTGRPPRVAPTAPARSAVDVGITAVEALSEEDK